VRAPAREEFHDSKTRSPVSRRSTFSRVDAGASPNGGPLSDTNLGYLEAMLAALLTQEEIDSICAPLRQGRAQFRFLQSLGIQVETKPNGKPLVRRSEWDRRTIKQHSPSTGPHWTVNP
jgi:hypothetical protein